MQRAAARDRRTAAVSQDGGGAVGRFVPAAALERQPRLPADEVQPPGLQAALGAVREAGVEVANGEVEPAQAQPRT